MQYLFWLVQPTVVRSINFGLNHNLFSKPIFQSPQPAKFLFTFSLLYFSRRYIQPTGSGEAYAGHRDAVTPTVRHCTVPANGVRVLALPAGGFATRHHGADVALLSPCNARVRPT